MRFICTEQCELPFVLNLPDGVYQVDLNGTAYELEIVHGQFAVHAGKMFAVGLPEFLRSQFGAEFDRAYKQPLRTVARHISTVKVQESGLPSVTDAEVSQDMLSVVQGEDPGKYAGKTDDLNKEAQRRLSSMLPEDLAAFRLRAAKMRVAHRMGNPDDFLTALNTLIRRYMQQFNDFFVEEVTYHQLAAQTPLTGVFVHVVCDSEVLHNHGRIGKAPPIMFRPWAIHPQPDIDQFKKDLGQGAPTNSVLLLEVRAKAFLERGYSVGDHRGVRWA